MIRKTALATVLVVIIALSIIAVLATQGGHREQCSTCSSSSLPSGVSTSDMSDTSASNSSSSFSTHSVAPVPVGAFLYLWYGNSSSNQGGLGSPGWNATGFPGGGSVVDKPTAGFYISDSNQTFQRQISEMQRADLTFAVVSWWGFQNSGEAAAIDKATLHLFKYLKTSQSKFQVAIMVDAYLGASEMNTNSTLMELLYNYIYDQFAGPYSNWYFNFEGKPLLMFFNPVYPEYVNSSFTVRTLGNRPNPVNWTFWDAPAQYFVSQNGSGVNASRDEGAPVIGYDGEISLVPRIDSYFYFEFGYGNSYLRFDPNFTMGLYQEQWTYTIAHKNSVKLVIIYSWNEYHERSEIEPHFDFANSTLDSFYLTNLTKSYASQLNYSP